MNKRMGVINFSKSTLSKKLLICIGLILPLQVFPQITNLAEHELEVINFIPRSPEAAMLGKYGGGKNVGAKGLAEINIPLYEISIDGISIPISISYLSDGIRVNEIPSIVGLKWVLNYGGMISRSIIGVEDQLDDGWMHGNDIMNSFDITSYPCPSMLYNQLHDNTYDFAPDHFSYNFLGYNGNFFFDYNCGNCTEVIMAPDHGIKIKPENWIDSFLITDALGNQFFFNQKEKMKIALNYNVGSSIQYAMNHEGFNGWKLGAVVSAKEETILFEYEEFSYETSEYLANSKIVLNNIVPDGSGSQGSANNYYQTNRIDTHTSQRIQSISTPFETLGFSYSSIQNFGHLERIVVTEKSTNTILRTINFEYVEMSGRVQLKGLTICPNNECVASSNPQKYTFSYDDRPIPNFGSPSQDVFGYINSNTQEHMIPLTGYPKLSGGNEDGSIPDGLEQDGEQENVTDWDNYLESVGDNIPCPPCFYPANRDVDANLITSGILTRITYPTRGYTTFQFEPNRSSYASENNMVYGPGVRLKAQKDFDSNGALLTQREFSYANPIFYPYAHKPKNYIFHWNLFIGSDDSPAPIPKNRYEQIFSSSIIPYHLYYDPYFSELENPIYDGLVWPPPQPLPLFYTMYIDGEPSNMPDWRERINQDINATFYNEVVSIEVGNGSIKEIYAADFNGINVEPNICARQFYDVFGSMIRSTETSYEYIYPETLITYRPIGDSYLFNGLYTGGECNDASPDPLTGLYQLYTPNFKRYTVPLRAIRKKTDIETEYFADRSHAKTIAITSFNSIGFVDSILTSRLSPTNNWQQPVILRNVKYPMDGYSTQASPGWNLNELIQSNIISLPIEVSEFLQLENQERFLIRSSLIRYNEKGQPLTKRKWIGSDKQTENSIRQFEEIANYSYNPETKRIIEAIYTDGKTDAFIWGYNQRYPIAKIVNANHQHVAYSGFESIGDMGGWNYQGTTILDVEAAHTGKYYYNVYSGWISRDIQPGTYELSYWLKAGSLTITGGTIDDISQSVANPKGWVMYRKKVVVPTAGTITISSGPNTFIDELRFHPIDALMETYTYDPGVGVTSTTDPNGTTTYYEYDGLGRLVRVRDHENNIIKEYEYHYAQ